MKILDGKATSSAIKEEIKADVEKLKAEKGVTPHLAAVLVGKSGASVTYVNAKVKACEQVGFKSTLIQFDESVTEEELLAKIEELNNDSGLHGFIVQLPLPKHIDEHKVTLAISPEKDVDGFHPTNLGKMILNLPTFLPATPYGIMQLLERNDIETEGKHCVVIGRSNIVGKPMSILMGRDTNPGNCTVTLVHRKSVGVKEITKQADILIVAVGRAGFLTREMVKEGAVVIDVGIHRIEDNSKKNGYRLIGDVNFDEVSPLCEAIAPVPGGVGPMTIVSLLKNTLQSAQEKA